MNVFYVLIRTTENYEFDKIRAAGVTENATDYVIKTARATIPYVQPEMKFHSPPGQFHHESSLLRETPFRKCWIAKNRGFSLAWSPHQDYNDLKRVPTLIKPAQQVKLTAFFASKGLMRKTSLLAVFQRKIKPLSHNGAKQFIVSFNCLEVHIHNMMIKKAPRHSWSQPNKSNLLFFRK